jgi:hypothetical protein
MAADDVARAMLMADAVFRARCCRLTPDLTRRNIIAPENIPSR